MKLNRKRSLAWDHFMKIFHVDDLDKPEAERRIDQVRCQPGSQNGCDSNISDPCSQANFNILLQNTII